MKTTIRGIVVGAVFVIATGVYGQVMRQEVLPIQLDQPPQDGTYWSLKAQISDNPGPPLPFNPFQDADPPVPVFYVGRGQFLYDDTAMDYGTELTFNLAAQDFAGLIGRSPLLSALTSGVPMPPGDGGGSETNQPPSPPADPPIMYPTNATLNWQLPLAGTCVMNPAVAPDGTIYVPQAVSPGFPGYVGSLWAINPDMSVKWETDIPVGAYGAPVVGLDGTIYVVLAIGGICAISPTNGSVLWTNLVAGEATTPALAHDGTLYVTDSSYRLYAITNGSVKWVYVSTNALVYGAPVIAADGTIYVNSGGGGPGVGNLIALNPDGTLKWVASPPPSLTGSASAPALGPDGTIYYSSMGFYAVRPDGSFKWIFSNWDHGEVFGYVSPEIGVDGTIYQEAAGGDPIHELYAFNPDGTVKWTRPLDTNVWPNDLVFKKSTCAIASDGEIYVPDSDGTIYSFAPDGTTNWTYVVNPGGRGQTAPIFGPDGTFYVGSYWFPNLLSFASPARIACSAWPEFRKNSRNTAAKIPAELGGHLSNPVMGSNAFHFSVSAPTNTAECICASRDLVNWTNLGQLVLTNESVNYADTQSTNFQYRFYRILPQ